MAVRTRLAAVIVALLMCGAASAGDIYQWKDAKGVTHFSDAPPPKGRYQARDIHHRDGEAAPADAGKPTTAASANCTLARTNLDRLKAGGDIGLDANGDGKPDAPLSDAEREKQTQLAEANIKTFCAPTATAATP
ncbi:MAG TPA: DUF4124 domain-containing protein [Luteimonas sp.]|nr:DUF4124 domain-containing protein [Luteimonas sp.]